MRTRTLLDDIRLAIHNAGGRIAMGYYITQEAPEWFDKDERLYFEERHRWNESRRKKQGKGTKQREDIWSDEDKQFILDKFGTIKTSKIGEIINRSSAAIRIKFAEIASIEQKKAATNRMHKSRRKYNFK